MTVETPIRLIGHDKIMGMIKNISNPARFFDPVFAKTARESTRDLKITTPRKTGNTARGWSNPVKLGESAYLIQNKVMTRDQKHSIPRILNFGRGEVFPKKPDGLLYIPLSEKGRAKRTGGPIPKDLVFGIDYVLARKAKAYSGTRFIEKWKVKTAQELTRRIILSARESKVGG